MTTNNWKLTLAYDGTAFHGWQVQPGGKTIQGTLSDAIAIVAAERVLPQGAGRTDAGVHAAGQVASFALAAPIPADNFLRALNRVLPSAIRVLSAEKTAPDFHARHSSVSKVYRYRVFHGPVCSPFLAPYVACSRWPLDMEAMQRAAKEILGEHDFTSFAASDPDRAARLADENDAGTSQSAASDLGAPRSPSVSNIRRIDESQWSCEPLCGASALDVRAELNLRAHDSEQDRESCAQIFTYTIRGNGFLHHMVRNLVGTFLEVGRGRIAAADIPRILNGRDRTLAGPTAPANGLCLMKVLY
ncbi:MAG: tRNA pseudouridine synthase A [Acidobacteriaceae bacterium]